MELRIQGVNSFATGPAWASYDVDAATMHMERHERGIHALRPGTNVAGVTQARSAVRRGRRWDASRPRSAQADDGYVAAGRFSSRIAARFPLSSASEAHTRLASRTVLGKILLQA
jgi:hypothetical protein